MKRPRLTALLLWAITVITAGALVAAVALFINRYRTATVLTARTGSAQVVGQVANTVGNYVQQMDDAMALLADAMDEQTGVELAPIAQAKGKRAPKDGRGIAQGHRGKHPGEIERPIFFLGEWGIVNEIDRDKGTPFAIRRGELGAWALRISRVVPGNRGFVKILEDRRLLFRGSDGIEFRDGIRGTEIGGGNGATQVETMVRRDVVIGRDAWIMAFPGFPEESLRQGKRARWVPGRIGEINRDDKDFLLPDGWQAKTSLARQKVRIDGGDVLPDMDEALQGRRRGKPFSGNEVKAFSKGREFVRDEGAAIGASA